MGLLQGWADRLKEAEQRFLRRRDALGSRDTVSLCELTLDEDDHYQLSRWLRDLPRYEVEFAFDDDERGARFGLVLLMLAAERARREAVAGEVWPQLSTQQLFHRDTRELLFADDKPSAGLYRTLQQAAGAYGLRHAYDDDSDARTSYRTIRLQYGIGARELRGLASWLANDRLPWAVEELLRGDQRSSSFVTFFQAMRDCRVNRAAPESALRVLEDSPFRPPVAVEKLLEYARAPADALVAASLAADPYEEQAVVPGLEWSVNGDPLFRIGLPPSQTILARATGEVIINGAGVAFARALDGAFATIAGRAHVKVTPTARYSGHIRFPDGREVPLEPFALEERVLVFAAASGALASPRAIHSNQVLWLLTPADAEVARAVRRWKGDDVALHEVVTDGRAPEVTLGDEPLRTWETTSAIAAKEALGALCATGDAEARPPTESAAWVDASADVSIDRIRVGDQPWHVGAPVSVDGNATRRWRAVGSVPAAHAEPLVALRITASAGVLRRERVRRAALGPAFAIGSGEAARWVAPEGDLDASSLRQGDCTLVLPPGDKPLRLFSGRYELTSPGRRPCAYRPSARGEPLILAIGDGRHTVAERVVDRGIVHAASWNGEELLIELRRMPDPQTRVLVWGADGVRTFCAKARTIFTIPWSSDPPHAVAVAWHDAWLGGWEFPPWATSPSSEPSDLRRWFERVRAFRLPILDARQVDDVRQRIEASPIDALRWFLSPAPGAEQGILAQDDDGWYAAARDAFGDLPLDAWVEGVADAILSHLDDRSVVTYLSRAPGRFVVAWARSGFAEYRRAGLRSVFGPRRDDERNLWLKALERPWLRWRVGAFIEADGTAVDDQQAIASHRSDFRQSLLATLLYT